MSDNVYKFKTEKRCASFQEGNCPEKENLDKIERLARERAQAIIAEQTKNQISNQKYAFVGKNLIEYAHNLKNNLCIFSGFMVTLQNHPEMSREYELLNKFFLRTSNYLKTMIRATQSGEKYEKIFCFNELIREEVDLFLLNRVIKNQIQFELSLTNVPMINGNQYEFGQVIHNIILNSIQSMEETKTKIIHITSEYDDEKDRIILNIRDTGCGIASENIQKMFTENFTTKQNNGFGIGLLYIKRVIEENHGKIYVSSRESVGTCFTLHIPGQKMMASKSVCS